MGYEEEEVDSTLKNYKFNWASDLIAYLENPIEEIDETKLQIWTHATANFNTVNKKVEATS